MVYYIIIRGALGIGKSTISENLAKILKANHILIDNILKKNDLDHIDDNIGCISPKNFIKGNKIILPEVKKNLEKGKIVIFDACFYHKEVIEHLIKNLPYNHYVFTLKASLENCRERDSKRKKACGKEAAMAVYKLVSKFNYGIVINTNKKNIKEVVKKILSYLPKD
tara:strand:- start:320 stop:820 length:501 start_codon:yes stop_codon:yes gene_type:complete